jgi:AmmeMemoRadiSam system protein A
MNLDLTHRSRLLALARQSIESGLSALRWVPMPSLELPAPLAEERGSFVTLRIHKRLRGCCGNLSANRSVSEDVWRNAWASAFADPRFPPLEAEEWEQSGTDVHISVLSPLESVVVTDEHELLELLRPNVDGLVLERDDSRATFLPDVWEHLPEPVDFVRHLKQKAGWPASSWSPHIKVWRYTTESFGEVVAEEGTPFKKTSLRA